MNLSKWLHSSWMWCLVLGLAPDVLVAQEWIFRQYGQPAILSDVRVSDVTEDAAGKIWVATWGAGLIGLSELEHEIYQVADGMPSDWTYAVAATPDGGIWCAGPDGIAYVHEGNLQTFTTANTPSLPSNEVPSIIALQDGSVAAGVGHGYILRYDPAHPDPSWSPLATPDILGQVQVRALAQTADGTLWAAGGSGGLWRQRETGWEKVSDPALHPTNAENLFIDSAGRLFSCAFVRVSVYDGAVWHTLPNLPAILQCINELPSGQIVAGTDKGLFMHQPLRGWQQVPLGNEVGQPLIKAIHHDQRDMMWMACYEGLIQGRRPLWSKYQWSGEGTRLISNALHATPAEAPYSLDTRGNLLQYQDGQFQPVAQFQGLSAKRILRSALDPEKLWVLTEVALLELDLGKREVRARHPVPLSFEADRPIESPAGDLLLLTLSGLYRLDNGTWQLLPEQIPDFQGGRLTGVAHTPEGSLYLCTEFEAFHWNNGQYERLEERFPVFKGMHFMDVLVTREGSVWFATSGEGIFILRDGNLTQLTPEDGLPSNRISKLFEASDGTLWVATRRAGVSAYRDGRWIHFQTRHGLPNSSTTGFYEAADGAIWLSTNDDGVYRYLAKPGAPTSTIISAPEEISHRRTGMVWLEGRDAWNRTPRNDLAFSWRFVPVKEADTNQGWSPFSPESVAVIAPRAPGRYLFEARTADMDRNIDPTPTGMLITVTPPIWRTLAFQIPTALLSLIALTALLAWFRVMQAERRAKQALEVTAASLEHAQRVAHIGNWEWDVQTGDVLWSAEVFRILGLTPVSTPITSEKFLDAVHPDERKWVDDLFIRAVTDLVPPNFDHRILRPGGEVRFVHEQGELVLDEEGRVLRVFGTLADITERKLNEQERDRLIQELRDALAQVRTLSGLVPICANCKNIRDDRGYWHQIEIYVRDRSHAEFSHSICPDCAEVLYGDRSIGEH